MISRNDYPPIPGGVKSKDKPIMIIAKTIKGKGISFLEDKNGWHGKALKKRAVSTGPAGTGRGR